MKPQPERSRSQRRIDVLEKLRSDVDLWVASADDAGGAYLVVEAIPIRTDPRLEDAHAEATGFDPRKLAEEHVYLRITPHSIQAWRESNELAGRQLMRKGEWY